jgi:murein DD-endopeptidase MepM/ murein hydrolase activator NlpD
MEDIDAWADSPLWDDERSRGRYSYPLQISRQDAIREGKRLAMGNPPYETYRRNKFWCALSPDSHKSAFKWAIDFLVPDETPVLAAADGVVIEVIEHNDKWGDGREYRDLMNRVTIQHDNGEITQYCHLAKMSVSEFGVQRMNTVKRGQRIGTVGKTGWTDRDHLHLLVFRPAQNESPFTFKSLKPRFRWF